MPARVHQEAGERFGKWTLIREVRGGRRTGGQCWLCRCECGREKPIRVAALRRDQRVGITSQCKSCSAKEVTAHGEQNVAWVPVEAGDTFGRYTLIAFHDTTRGGQRWRVRCSCSRFVGPKSVAALRYQVQRGEEPKCMHCGAEARWKHFRQGLERAPSRSISIFEQDEWTSEDDTIQQELRRALRQGSL